MRSTCFFTTILIVLKFFTKDSRKLTIVALSSHDIGRAESMEECALNHSCTHTASKCTLNISQVAYA
jgi:hypothetical protein